VGWGKSGLKFRAERLRLCLYKWDLLGVRRVFFLENSHHLYLTSCQTQQKLKTISFYSWRLLKYPSSLFLDLVDHPATCARSQNPWKSQRSKLSSSSTIRLAQNRGQKRGWAILLNNLLHHPRFDVSYHRSWEADDRMQQSRRLSESKKSQKNKNVSYLWSKEVEYSIE
jgi:hypothetical protein